MGSLPSCCRGEHLPGRILAPPPLLAAGLGRSAAVPSRSSTDFTALPDRAQTRLLADMLRLGTAAFRWRCQNAPICPRDRAVSLQVKFLLKKIKAPSRLKDTRILQGEPPETAFRSAFKPGKLQNL